MAKGLREGEAADTEAAGEAAEPPERRCVWRADGGVPEIGGKRGDGARRMLLLVLGVAAMAKADEALDGGLNRACRRSSSRLWRICSKRER